MYVYVSKVHQNGGMLSYVPLKDIGKIHVYYARIQRGAVVPPNHKNKGFLSNTGLNPLKTYDHKATKPAFNVGPSSAR